MSESLAITCPSCGSRLGFQFENGQILINQGHKRALVSKVEYIKCRRPIPRDGGGEMHCPGTWTPAMAPVYAHV